MKMVLSAFTLLVHIALLSRLCFGGDPTVYTELRVSYTTVSPLGVPQQVPSSFCSFFPIEIALLFHLGHCKSSNPLLFLEGFFWVALVFFFYYLSIVRVYLFNYDLFSAYVFMCVLVFFKRETSVWNWASAKLENGSNLVSVL